MPLFGEIVEPVSRALYIDESSDDEDIQDLSASTTANIEWVDESPVNIETLFVFHGHLAAEFLHKILQGTNSKATAQLKEKLFQRSRKAPEVLNIFMYRLSESVFGCLCPSEELERSNFVLDKLVPIFNTCKLVAVVATIPAPFYKGNDPTLDLPPSFMRMLYTSTFDNKDTIAPLLETPNMITGVPAAILNWCEVFQRPGCLYVCYSDSDHLDSISAEPLVKIFLNGFKGLFGPKIVSFQSASQEPNSTLYM